MSHLVIIKVHCITKSGICVEILVNFKRLSKRTLDMSEKYKNMEDIKNIGYC